MSAKAVLICLLTTCLLGCVGEKPYDHDPIRFQGRDGVIYKRGDGRAIVECRGSPVPNQCASLDKSGVTDQVYLDCSNDQFECLFNTSDVLAIPKAGLASGQKYTVFGANLTVERCFGDQGACEIAVIRSECADAQICTCRSAVPGRILTFYYSHDFGVTAFYAIARPTEVRLDSSTLSDAIPLLTYTLVAEKGFLQAPSSLGKATLGACANR